MHTKHVFKSINQDLSDLFDQAEHPAKVACVIFDYAKSIHKALICDGQGRELKGAFDVENSAAGVRIVCDQIKKTCRRFAIKPSHVVVGGEDCGNFSLIIELGGTVQGTEYDFLDIAGSATLGEELNIQYVNSFAPRLETVL